MKTKFWFRWAWRDLRLRWLQVAAIAMIIALGTGIFAGLGGQEAWRVAMMDINYEKLQMHDLQVSLTTGSYVDQDRALAALHGIEGVELVEPRLMMDTLVDASTAEQTILVNGRLVGVDFSNGGPFVDNINLDKGRMPKANDNNAAILETKFASYYDLEPGTQVTLIGGIELDIVGTGISPEYFMIVPEQVAFVLQGEANLAVIYLPLSTVQEIYQQQGRINDLRIQLRDGSDPAEMQARIEHRLAESLPDIGFQVTHGEDEPVRAMLYADAEEDQEMFNLIAIFFLIGAALAAFNLAGRIVESQRRQIGIGMALGAPRHWLVFRPLLIGLQIALIGLALGLPLGFLFTRLFGQVIDGLTPMPFSAGNMLDTSSFLWAATLGIMLPLLATMIPVWGAVRVEPLEALHGHLVSKSSGLNKWFKNIRLPGNTFTQMPFKNILRSPKRTVLTVLGLAVAIALLFLFLGLLDTFIHTLDQAKQSLLYRSPDRVIITLNSFYPAKHEQIENLTSITVEDNYQLFSHAEPGVRLGGKLVNDEKEIDTLLEFIPTESAIWIPALIEGSWGEGGEREEIVISRKAAEDLSLQVGDNLMLEHPFREGQYAFRNITTALTVTGIHDNPLRSLSYLNLEQASFTGLDDLTNMLVVTPGQDITPAEIRQHLFIHPVIFAIDEATMFTEAIDRLLDVFINMLRIMQGVVLFIAFLIAFNSTSINIDDRIREVSTMFAFGTRPHMVTRMQIGENVLLGILGTALGGILGWIALKQMMAARMEVMLENIDLLVIISPMSLSLAVLLGVGVVALTPLVSARKLKRIDIPSTLRVIE